jgi:hypothetical protein
MASPSLRDTTGGFVTEGRQLDELRERVRASAARHPYWVLAAAAGVGLVVGRLLRRRPTTEARLIDAAASSLEALAERLQVPTDARPQESTHGAARFLRSAFGLWFSWALRRQLAARPEARSLAGVREPI